MCGFHSSQAQLKELEEKLSKERQKQKEIVEKASMVEDEFARKTAQQIAQKLQEASDKREAHYRDLIKRLKEHVSISTIPD